MQYNILVINPGSTSDDLGYYKGNKTIFDKSIRYNLKDMKKYEGQKINAQFALRKKNLLETLKEYKIDLKEIDVVIGRGGVIKPIPSGVYKVNKAMLIDLAEGKRGDHSSNLGGILADDIAKKCNAKAFIADPVVVDEMDELARYSGMPENPRTSIFHALNQKRVALLAAKELKKKYEKCNFIVMHGGGGVSVGAHKNGKVVDVNNALDGDGPFTPQRSGGVPVGGLVKMCFSGRYTEKELKLKIKGKGGMIAYTGTSDLIDLVNFIKTGKKAEKSSIVCNREDAKRAVDAMIYQLTKEIGAMYGVLEGKIDAVILTGGFVGNPYIKSRLLKKLNWAKKIFCYPGGDEKAALKEAAIRAMDNPKIIKTYK